VKEREGRVIRRIPIDELGGGEEFEFV